MSNYTALTEEQQSLFKMVLQAYFDINFNDDQWAELTPFIQKVNCEVQGQVEESAKAFGNMLISFNPKFDKSECFQVFLNDFKENMAECELIDIINITYETMSAEQKGFMLDYVSKYTGFIFEQENIDKLFATAPSDRAFTRMTSGTPDTFDRQFFTPFIWARLIGEDAPDMFEFKEKHAKLTARIKNEGPAMFDELHDYRAVFEYIVNGF